MAYTPLVAKDGNNASQGMGALQDASGNNFPQVNLDSNRPTFRATGSFTPFATAAVTVASVQGSASKTIRIKRILLGGAATALSDTLFRVARTSALGTGGTIAALTNVKMDTLSAAATAVVNTYTTAAQSAGTGSATGGLTTLRLFQDTVTTPTVTSREATMLYPERGVAVGQAIVLRGPSEFIEIQNANAGNLAAGTVLDLTVEWEEDAS